VSSVFLHRATRFRAALATALGLGLLCAVASGCSAGRGVATASPVVPAGPTTTPIERPGPLPKPPARVPRLAKKAAGAPNYVVVMVDDQSTASFKRRYMPTTFRWLVDHGTRFSNGLAAPPLCCPDRAGVLTGQYPHHSGVFTNHPGYASLRDKHDTLPVWLHQAGYRTGFVGKFLNFYDTVAGAAPAPGFDSWLGYYGPERYVDYDLSDGTNILGYGDGRNDYSTDVLTAGAKAFIDASSQQPNPFFLWLAYHAPHRNRIRSGHCKGHNPLPASKRDFERYEHAKLPQPPSYNEKNVSDKPLAIAGLPKITPSQQGRIRQAWKCTLATMRDVDRGVGRVMRDLRADGELSNTIVFYLSDNGVFFGEHRIASGKQFAYEPALQVPFAVRVPRALRTTSLKHRRDQIASNVDIAPTMLDFAGLPQRPPVTCSEASRCRTLDGRSLAPLLGRKGEFPKRRAALAEIRADQTAYHAIRARNSVLISYEDGEEELYDLARDPFELRNIAGAREARPLQRKLEARLAKLRDCAGVRGRDPQQAGHPFCE
jgi:N-acetylglucosamine-6-sulfatase